MAFPFVHLDCDFKIPSRMGDIIELTLLVERIGRSSLRIAIVCHHDGLERLRAHMVTAMMSLETRQPVPLPPALRDEIEAYQRQDRGRRSADDYRCALARRRVRGKRLRAIAPSHTA